MISYYIKSCSNCRHGKKSALEEPCCIGTDPVYPADLMYSCNYYRPSLKTKLKLFWEKFTDDQEFIRVKLAIAMILIIIGMALDR